MDELIVGKTYNPLPAHLTLVSRFYSEASPEEIVKIANPIFGKTNSIELLFEDAASLGPKQTAADLIISSKELLDLHRRVIKSLTTIDASYTNPQFVGDGWKPHVSKRAEQSFSAGDQVISSAAYLIEVKIDGTDNQVRHIRHKFSLAP